MKILTLLLFIITSNAQIESDTFKITSESHDTSFQIDVFTPNSYKDSTNFYPVVYILDGQFYFPLAVSIQRMLGLFGYLDAPECIVVSINTHNYKKRYSLYNDDDLEFLSVIKNKILPTVEKKYRTSEKYLFGWQYAGSFAVRVMIEHPNIFDAFYIADPYPLMNKFDTVFKRTYEKLNKSSAINVSLYMAYGNNGATVKEGAAFLENALKELNIKGLKWISKELVDEDHRSSPFNTLYSGIKFHHHNYQILSIDSYSEYKSLGELNYIKQYYEDRSKRYGLENSIDPFTLISLLRSSLRANNFDNFYNMFTVFKHTDFLKNIRPLMQ